MLRILPIVCVLLGAGLLFGAAYRITQILSMINVPRIRMGWQLLRAGILVVALSFGGFVALMVHENSQPPGELEDVFAGAVMLLLGLFLFAISNLASSTTKSVRRLQKLERIAYRDPLTGLFNRRHLDDQLDEFVNRPPPHLTSLSLIAIDIDRFKSINDEFGHQAGDEVISRIGNVIARNSRSNDVVARYGGDELMILSPNSTTKSAQDFASRIRRMIEDTPVTISDGKVITVTASLGVAILRGDDKTQDLIGRADQALYRAKHRGRNRVVVETREVVVEQA